jgi:hypothetical protein
LSLAQKNNIDFTFLLKPLFDRNLRLNTSN